MRITQLKIQYVLIYAIVGSYLPYMPVYLHSLDLSDAETGWVLGAYGIALLIMPTLITHLADKHWSNRSLMTIGYVCSVIALVFMSSQNPSFIALLFLSILFSLAYTPIFSLLDGLTFAHLGQLGQSGQAPPPYHRVRFWGSIGFMLPAFVLYLGMNFYGWHTRAAIITSAVFAGIAGISAMTLPTVQRNNQRPGVKIPSAKAWRAIARKPVSTVIGSLIFAFIAIAMFYAFYTRLLEEQGVDKKWLGLIVNIGVVCELPLVFASGWFVRRFTLRGVMLIGGVALILRMGLLGLAPTPFVLIATQVLHAPIVLWLYLVPPMYLNLKADDSFRNSMQGLYTMLAFGAARVVGAVLGGYLAVQTLQLTFTIGAVLAVIAFLWILVSFRDPTAERQLQAQTQTTIEQPHPDE